MTHIVTVPLSTLTLSRHNIRRTRRDDDIDAMIASIAAEGLLQNLTVARIPPDEDQPAERYEVIAGGRRLRAMQALADTDRLPEALRQGVPVNIVSPDIANEVGLAENTIRAPMHPHDEFVAFRDLAAAGHGIDTIAARFGVTPLVVERRLKLANVSPVLLRLHRDNKLSVDQMQAFALSDDHAQQERIYEAAEGNAYRLRPEEIRRALTQREVPTTDPRVKFVGLATYEQAGGVVRRDLFDDAGGGYVLDETLLDQLVEERLQAEAKKLEAEGWKFVRIERDGDEWKFRNGCDKSTPKTRDPTPEETARALELNGEIARLRCVVEEKEEASEFELEDDPDVERLEDLANEHAALAAARSEFTERQKAKSGCQIYVDYNGQLIVHRGLIPREGSKSEATANKAQADATGTKPKPKTTTLAESMIRRLTAHRTLALQAALFARRDIALRALAHGLLIDLLYVSAFGHRDALYHSPLEVSAKDKHHDLSRLQFADLDASPVMRKLDADIEQLRESLNIPPQRPKFWPWLLQQNDETVLSLLALVAVVSLDATVGFIGDDHASDPIAAALDIDYADYWSATPEAFTNLVPKALAFEALAEAIPDKTQRAGIEGTLAGQGKEFIASEIARHLVARRWLPKPLRRPGYKPGAKAEATPVDDAAPKKKPAAKSKAKPKPAAKKPAAKKAPATKRGKAKPKKKAA